MQRLQKEKFIYVRYNIWQENIKKLRSDLNRNYNKSINEIKKAIGNKRLFSIAYFLTSEI